MTQKNFQITGAHTIKCCRNCVPPKRHTACWGHCPEYLKENAEYEARKAIEDKKRRVGQDIYGQKSAGVTRAIKRHK